MLEYKTKVINGDLNFFLGTTMPEEFSTRWMDNALCISLQRFPKLFWRLIVQICERKNKTFQKMNWILQCAP